jgi:hypothetical protein
MAVTLNWRFYFNWERACGQPTPRYNDAALQAIGAQVIAYQASRDNVLLELIQTPPAAANPYYAGWWYAGSDDSCTVTTIHHPKGDVKRLTNSDPTDSCAYLHDFEAAGQEMYGWYVGNWADGTVEPGSSDAPVFSSTGHVIGVITRGDHDNICVSLEETDSGALSESLYGSLTSIDGLTFMDGFDPVVLPPPEPVYEGEQQYQGSVQIVPEVSISAGTFFHLTPG